MQVFRSINNLDVFLQAYRACINAVEVSPRGQATRELMNAALIFEMSHHCITNFSHRELNLNYCKREWLWYLGADPFDDSIAEHAKMWQKLKQPDGSYYSNYGQYIFGTREEGRDDPATQLQYVVQTLRKDPDSRRASIVLLSRDHLFPDNVDVVCTYAINFCIAGNSLDMTVMMRSNDIIFGLTNDAFCFSQLYEFVYQLLRHTNPGLRRGRYTHFSNSLHVYERHYGMIRKILRDPRTIDVRVPEPTAREIVDLINSHGKEGDGEYTKWLKALD